MSMAGRAVLAREISEQQGWPLGRLGAKDCVCAEARVSTCALFHQHSRGRGLELSSVAGC